MHSRQHIIDTLAGEPDNERAASALGLTHYHVSRLREQLQMVPIAHQMDDGSDVSIEMIDPGVRLYSCLKRSGIDTVRQLLGRSWLQISSIPNLGAMAQSELATLLAVHELELAPTSLGRTHERKLVHDCPQIESSGRKLPAEG